jgi:hypothetical protein
MMMMIIMSPVLSPMIMVWITMGHVQAAKMMMINMRFGRLQWLRYETIIPV